MGYNMQREALMLSRVADRFYTYGFGLLSVGRKWGAFCPPMHNETTELVSMV